MGLKKGSFIQHTRSKKGFTYDSHITHDLKLLTIESPTISIIFQEKIKFQQNPISISKIFIFVETILICSRLSL